MVLLSSLVPGKQEQSVTSKQVINRVLLQHRVYYYEFIRRTSERCDPKLQSLGKKSCTAQSRKTGFGMEASFPSALCGFTRLTVGQTVRLCSLKIKKTHQGKVEILFCNVDWSGLVNRRPSQH